MFEEYFDDKLNNIDMLTKVYTREVIFGFIDYLITKNIPFDLCILDVDNFKYVNDGHGHQTGDRALYEIAQRMTAILGDRGVVGRYGGDEFIMVAPYIVEYDDVWQVWHEMNDCTRKLKSHDLNDLHMTVTMGCARFPLDSTNIDGLFELADKALYRGKMKGRNCFIIYLKEKHANINLQTERDKIVSSTSIYSMVYNKLTKDDIKSGIAETINYVGSFFMIDHLCISFESDLYFDYYHPICKFRDFKALPSDVMEMGVNPHTGIFYKNNINDNRNKAITDALVEQGISSTFWIEIKAHDHFYGYLRADVCSNPSGRIWQNLDIDVLASFAHILALELYYRNKNINEL